MKIFIMFLLLLLTSGVTRAAVTVAWKVPVESQAADFRSDERYRKLDQPPAASAFFQAGDELWDVSKAISWPRGFRPTKREKKEEEGNDPFAARRSGDWDWNGEPDGKWDGEWVVWNARSRMFIARGSWEDVRQIEAGLKFNGRLEIFRTKLELVEAGQPSRSISLVSRSGEKSIMEVGGFKLELEADGREQIPENYAKLVVKWPSGKKGETWELATALTLKDAKPLRVAGHGSGAEEWELFASTEREWLDGTPVSPGRWIEEKGAVTLWSVPQYHQDEARDLGEGYKMALFYIGKDTPLKMVGHGSQTPSTAVEVPEKAAGLLRGSVMDLRPHLALNGIRLDEAREFAGFDPVSGHLLVIARDRWVQDIEGLLSGGGDPGVSHWVKTGPEAGAWRLSSRSGEKATLARKKNGEVESLFETELSSGGNGKIFDLSYRLQPGPGQLLQSKGTFLIDTPREAGSFTAAEGQEVKVILTAGSEPR
ncbi:hypothetical protein OJ996_07770 [Luteolibacter sp. GHJ8]|uniref:Uncharacterized protein n=1 Tax=Luteolibacter rhizosphaerae TaxID=2989719 RepID=A0ABT3G0W0_9BACT|nr:hypothetical protein [Luteolibacter rhizosphaerae]MCW1913466.1 hypothetical protein [Luteolibacter rhizosphaerae]